jgi:hypothetical protein
MTTTEVPVRHGAATSDGAAGVGTTGAEGAGRDDADDDDTFLQSDDDDDMGEQSGGGRRGAGKEGGTGGEAAAEKAEAKAEEKADAPFAIVKEAVQPAQQQSSTAGGGAGGAGGAGGVGGGGAEGLLSMMLKSSGKGANAPKIRLHIFLPDRTKMNVTVYEVSTVEETIEEVLTQVIEQFQTTQSESFNIEYPDHPVVSRMCGSSIYRLPSPR